MDDGNLRNVLHAAVCFYGNEVFSIFVPEQAAYEAGGVFLRIDGYSQLFMMLEITMQGVFYGIGRTVPPAIVSIVCNYMRIPLAILFVRMGMGVEGIWWASMRHNDCQRTDSLGMVHHDQEKMLKSAFRVNKVVVSFVILHIQRSSGVILT